MTEPPDIQKLLTERFLAAIRKCFRPCPLIGPNWFRFHPDGVPADFQFVGLKKLAKAIGRNPRVIAQLLMKDLDLGDLGVADVKLTDTGTIDVALHKPAPAQPGPEA